MNKSSDSNIKTLNVKGQIISSVISLMLAFVMLLSASYAWLSTNRVVSTDGIDMAMSTSENLIIAKTLSELQTMTDKDCASAGFKIVYSDTRDEMLPSTLDWGVGTATGLKYPKNTWNINFSTGLIKNSNLDYGFEAVPNAQSNDSEFYVDYDAYIASANKAMEGFKLVATIDSGDADLDNNVFLKAATIAFYVGTVSDNKLAGTISVKDEKTGSVLIDLPSNIIPCNTGADNGSIHVIARCFFDGALGDNSSSTYINSATIDTTNISLSIHYEAQEI